MSRIRILVTTDIHGSIFPYTYSDNKSAYQGMARCKTLIDSLRDENTIVIDNGDLLEGSPLSFFHYHNRPDQICPMTTALNAMEVDYINLGNHDFNYGEKALFQHLDACNAPCITSNVLYRGKSIGPTYVIEEVGGKKVALFGVVTSYIPHWESKENIAHCKFPDAFETAKKTVEHIKDLEKPDYIIGIYHGGLERDAKTNQLTEDDTGENQGSRMLKEIHGLDVLITGHQHRSFIETINGVVVTQTTSDAKEIACIDLYPEEKTIDAHILQADAEPDEHLMELVQEEEDACQVWLDQALGTCEMDLSIQDEMEARVHKSQVITLLNKIAMEATGAQLSGSALFLGVTGFDHTITMRNLVSTYVYPNTLVVKKVTGKVLKEYLEKNAEFFSLHGDSISVSPRYDYPKPQHYNYDMVDGITYTIHVSNDIGSRVTDLTYQGKPVTDDMEFTLAVNNYRANGGGNFQMIRTAPTVVENQSSMVELIADYILKHKTIDFEPVNNITVIR